VSNSSNLSLKHNQIVCLEHQKSCLYGEVIQLIPERQLCWFRPMCIVILDEPEQYLTESEVINLQFGSDLLWPLALFRPVLDTELLSFWGKLDNTSNLLISKKSSRQHLNSFVELFWQDNKDKF